MHRGMALPTCIGVQVVSVDSGAHSRGLYLTMNTSIFIWVLSAYLRWPPDTLVQAKTANFTPVTMILSVQILRAPSNLFDDVFTLFSWKFEIWDLFEASQSKQCNEPMSIGVTRRLCGIGDFEQIYL